MSEPLTGTGTASAALTGVTFVGLLSGVDAGVVIGAFAGAVVFVLSATEFPIWKRLVFFGISFVLGVLTAGFAASMISTVTPDSVVVEKSIGALVASATVVRILMVIISRSSNPTLNFKGGGK
ncbi:holin [Hafnia phage yong2]|nr:MULTISPECIES: phage holin family protein [Hafniaceae]MDU1193420.1 phage holin family protein [Enterobacteriaceae bacterium]QXN68777.1 holin [Hafnia phage yong2]MBW2958091.1 phage holin family protein [Hafnia paralvei]MCE9870287.1 phage holin family protein [Hafnia alvei]MDU1245515.1 phage holin family protein [Enterobacteriaceae bacterium]